MQHLTQQREQDVISESKDVSLEDERNLVDFFALLLAVDKRVNNKANL
ncbi:hypothetical protein KBC55_01770 [Patescibacteria group bacterium]|nr:hypothetical protein [Patescibacteria group bacterium]